MSILFRPTIQLRNLLIHQSKQYNIMKYTACILTFLSYSSLHVLRMCYSFNKFYIKKEFQITDFYLGVLDALVYLSLGIGTLMRYTLIRNPLHLTEIFLATSIASSFSIAIISYLGLISDYNNLTQHSHFLIFKIIITIALMVFGFMQLTSRPIATSILGSELKSQKHGCLVGAWATHSSAGHISGLLLSNLLVHTFMLKWEVSIFIGAILCIGTALLVYFVLQNPGEKMMRINEGQSSSSELDRQMEEHLRLHSSRQFYGYIKGMIRYTQYKFYIATYTIIKAMVYTFLLWFPLYLDSVKLKRYSGYITILFEIGAIAGSFLLGMLYDYQAKKFEKSTEKLQNVDQSIGQSTILQKLAASKSLISMFSMTVIVAIFYFSQKNFVGYCIFSLSVGFFLGGTANTLNSNDVMVFSNKEVRQIDYLTNFNTGVGSCFVGFVQLLMGFALYEANEVTQNEGFTETQISNTHHSYKMLFIILLALGAFVSVLFALRLLIKRSKREGEKYSSDIIQEK